MINHAALKKVMFELNIAPEATIIVDLMKFRLTSNERLNEFVERLPYERSELALLSKMRKEDIDVYGYVEKTTFLEDYNKYKQIALEKLFQEPIKQFKLNRLRTNDPELIYNTYQKLGKYSTLLEVALSIQFML
ncbi:hypothetical protein H6F38_23275 [Paenibacillus sp. EKM208P]|nr:hypothetical protein H6F38_23275 [Paenibacillus sp. EKM208P]